MFAQVHHDPVRRDAIGQMRGQGDQRFTVEVKCAGLQGPNLLHQAGDALTTGRRHGDHGLAIL